MLKKNLGDRIISQRKKIGMLQKELAEAVGVSPTALNYYEKNKREPRMDVLQKIAAKLGTSIDYLLTGEGDSRTISEIVNDSKSILDSYNPDTWKEATREDLSRMSDESMRIDTIKKYDSLNTLGQIEANKYLSDLAEHPKYKKNG